VSNNTWQPKEFLVRFNLTLHLRAMRLIRLRRHHVAQGSDSPLLRYSTALAIVRKASNYRYDPM
jgi:hypothetical protein